VGERGKTSEQSPTEEHCQTFDNAIVSFLSFSLCSDKCSFHSHQVIWVEPCCGNYDDACIWALPFV